MIPAGLLAVTTAVKHVLMRATLGMSLSGVPTSPSTYIRRYVHFFGPTTGKRVIYLSNDRNAGKGLG